MNVTKTTTFNTAFESSIKDVLKVVPRLIVVDVYGKLLNRHCTIRIKHIISEAAFDMGDNTNEQRQMVLKELICVEK